MYNGHMMRVWMTDVDIADVVSERFVGIGDGSLDLSNIVYNDYTGMIEAANDWLVCNQLEFRVKDCKHVGDDLTWLLEFSV